MTLVDGMRAYCARYMNLLWTDLAWSAGLVTLGNMASGGFRFLTVAILLASTLSVQDMGVLTACIAVMDLAAVLSECGVNTVLVRFAAAAPQSSFLAIVRRCLVIKVATVAVVLLGLAAWYPFFSRNPGLPAHPGIIYLLTAAAAIALSSNTFLMSISQARQHYPRYVGQAMVLNLVRFAVLAFIIWMGWRSGGLLIIVFFGAGAAAFVFSVILALPEIRGEGWGAPSPAGMGELLRFMLPVALLQAISIIMARMDVIMLERMTNLEVVGVYGLAFNLAYVFPLVSSAVFTVLLPRVAAMRDPATLIAYRRKTLGAYPIILVLAGAAAFLAPPLIPLFFDPAYVDAAPVLRLCFINFGVYAITSPLAPIMYALKRPLLLVPLHLIQLILLIPLNYWFISRMGALGPTMGTLVVSVLGVAGMVWLTGYALRQEQEGRAKHA